MEDLVSVDATVEGAINGPAPLSRTMKKAEQGANQQQPHNEDHRVREGELNVRAVSCL